MAGRTRFGKYELVARLAKGGMGETFRAELVAAAGVTKQVVIKKMLPYFTSDPTLVEAFVQEARLSASLSHANLAQVFDFGEVDGEYFIAMEYVDGRSLEKTLLRAQALGWARLPFQLSVYIVSEVLKGLQYAQTRTGPDGAPLNLVHRDISPDNVLLGFEGEVKLVDFGVAKTTMAGRKETEPGLVKGKFRYVSPEQAVAGPLDARSDLFTVGVMLYQLLTGELPYSGQQHTVMQAIVHGDYVRPRVRAGDIPDPLAEVIEKAMQSGREQRYGSAREMLEPLSRWLYGQSPDFSGEVLRELLGQLFDPELLADGRLFVSHTSARSKLAQLRPGREVAAPTQVVPALAAQPSGPIPQLDGAHAGSAAPTASSPAMRASQVIEPLAKKRPPVMLLGLAGALGAVAVGVVGWDIATAREEGLPAQGPAAVVAPVAAKPVVAAAKAKVIAAEDGTTPAPDLARQSVVFDAEAAPVNIHLTKSHQLRVADTNCFAVGKRWDAALGSAGRLTVSMPRGNQPTNYGSAGNKRMQQVFASAYGSNRLMPLFALFVPATGAPQVWLMNRTIAGTEPGKLCAFGASDRSLEQEAAPAQILLNGERMVVKHGLHAVEPDDRFVVRSFAPKKTWVVTVSDVSPPWPVLFVTAGGTETPYVLDQPELRLKAPVSAWITVPVAEELTGYSRDVSIELADGEKLKASAKDLLSQGRKLYSRERYGEAAKVLDQCINTYPEFPECHRTLGSTFAHLGYSDEARAQYAEFLRLAPGDPSAQTVMDLIADYDAQK